MSTHDVAVAGVGMHPWGKWGKQLRDVRRARRPRRARRQRRRLAGRRPDRRRRDRPQRVRRLRRRRDLRPGARLERRQGRDVVRRVRDRRPGARHRAGPDPRRPERGRAGRRRRHHPEGLPRPQRGRALGRPGLAAVPPARHDEPGVLRPLRAPPDGPVRRDPGGLRPGQGQEREARPGEPQRALPQGGQRRGRADQRRGLRPAAPARHLRDLRRRGRGRPVLDRSTPRGTGSAAGCGSTRSRRSRRPSPTPSWTCPTSRPTRRRRCPRAS